MPEAKIEIKKRSAITFPLVALGGRIIAQCPVCGCDAASTRKVADVESNGFVNRIVAHISDVHPFDIDKGDWNRVEITRDYSRPERDRVKLMTGGAL